MGRFDVDPFEHLGQQQISRLFAGALKHQMCHKINEEASDEAGIAYQIQSKLDHFFL